MMIAKRSDFKLHIDYNGEFKRLTAQVDVLIPFCQGIHAYTFKSFGSFTKATLTATTKEQIFNYQCVVLEQILTGLGIQIED